MRLRHAAKPSGGPARMGRATEAGPVPAREPGGWGRRPSRGRSDRGLPRGDAGATPSRRAFSHRPFRWGSVQSLFRPPGSVRPVGGLSAVCSPSTVSRVRAFARAPGPAKRTRSPALQIAVDLQARRGGWPASGWPDKGPTGGLGARIGGHSPGCGPSGFAKERLVVWVRRRGRQVGSVKKGLSDPDNEPAWFLVYLQPLGSRSCWDGPHLNGVLPEFVPASAE